MRERAAFDFEDSGIPLRGRAYRTRTEAQARLRAGSKRKEKAARKAAFQRGVDVLGAGACPDQARSHV